MHLPVFDLHEANTLDEASDLLIRFSPDARALAGGTDLLVDLKSGRVTARHIVSLNRLDELRGLREEGSCFEVGAMTTPNELAASQIVQTRFPALLDALNELAAPQVRNMATVGGNLTSAIPSADLPPILISHRAEVVLWSRAGQRRVPLNSFFVGPRRTIMKTGEILTVIRLPNPPERFGAAYARFALRQANACAVAGVAVGLTLDRDGVVTSAQVVLGAVAPTPLSVETAAACLIGQTLNDDTVKAAADTAMEAALPISDIRASADYRREIVGVLTRRALTSAGHRASGGVS